MKYFIFDLTRYCIGGEGFYDFFEGLFNVAGNKKNIELDRIGIKSSTYRNCKSRNSTETKIINEIIDYYHYNYVSNDEKAEIETLISKIHYSVYYKEVGSFEGYLEELEQWMVKRNYLYPVLSLFKVLVKANIELSFPERRESVKDDIQYLKCFLNTNYFTNELKLIYLSLLYFFDEYNVCGCELLELSLKYKRFSWLYYNIEFAKAYLNKEDLKMALYGGKLIEEYRESKNMKRYLHILNDTAYAYNLLGLYDFAFLYLSDVIEYIYVDVEDGFWQSNILNHYLYTNFMFNKYEAIIEFVNNRIFNPKVITKTSAIIYCISSYMLGRLDYLKYLKYNEEDEDIFLLIKYFETRDEKLLKDFSKYPYAKRLKEFLISHNK